MRQMSAKATPKTQATGRPPKFAEPRRPVTVTLPERTLRQLALVDEDRAKAIVKVTDLAVEGRDPSTQGVRLVELTGGKSLIVVGRSRSLERIPWLRLVEIAPARFLLAIPSGTATESLEVALLDVLDGLPDEEREERALLERLRDLMRHGRQRDGVSKAELLLIDTVERGASRTGGG